MSTTDTQALTEDDLTVLFWELVKKEDDKFRDSEEAIAACDYFREGFRAALALAQPAPTAAGEPIAWETITPVYKQFVSDRWYQKSTPAVKRWYKPYRCSACAALPLAGDAPLQGEGK